MQSLQPTLVARKNYKDCESAAIASSSHSASSFFFFFFLVFFFFSRFLLILLRPSVRTLDFEPGEECSNHSRDTRLMLLLAHLVGALPLRRANRMFNSFRELLQQLQYINFWKVNSHGCEARLLDVARTNLLGVQLFCFPWYHMITGIFFLQ